jgi:peptidase E
MTTLLLHGGRLKLPDERNDSYFKRLTRDLFDGDDVLFVGFARRDEADRAEVFAREKGFILAQTTKKLTVTNATHDKLAEQLAAAKAIHITGGESPSLVQDIKKYPDFLKLIEGKTVGGSSAGACLFSAKYWYGEENRIYEGLGVLSIALFVHYGSAEFNATEDKFSEFKDQTEDLEPVALEECAWAERLI